MAIAKRRVIINVGEDYLGTTHWAKKDMDLRGKPQWQQTTSNGRLTSSAEDVIQIFRCTRANMLSAHTCRKV
jgi:hypothetical protein